MPLSHFSKVFAVTDAKIAKVTADPAGGATTYATSIDVPGIKSVKVTGTIESKTLRGDNTLLDADAVLTDVKVAVEQAKMSLDELAAFMNLSVADAGTTPNQTATLGWTGASTRMSPFRLSAVSASSDVIGGNVSLVFYKCILSSFPNFGLAEEDYQFLSFDATPFPQLGTLGKWFDIAFNETALVLT